MQVGVATGAIVEEFHDRIVRVGKIRGVEEAWGAPEEIVGVTVVAQLSLAAFCARHVRGA